MTAIAGASAITAVPSDAAETQPGYQIFVAPHSHIDLEWYWTLEQSKAYSRRILTQALRMLRSDPRFTFTQDQRLALEPFWEELPADDRAFLRRMASEGRFEATTGMDVQPDVNFSSFEVLSRQFLVAAPWMESAFGQNVETAWNIDTFGHTVQMPQLFRKAGLRYAVFTRGVSETQQQTLRNPFYWQSPDGSRVLAYWLPNGYAAGGHGLDGELQRLVNQAGIRKILLLWGNDLYLPVETTAEIERKIRAAAASKQIPVVEVVFCTPRTYFRTIEADGVSLPTVSYDFNPAVNLQDLRGLYATRPTVKLLNRQAENALTASEILSSVASSLGAVYPAERLRTAWDQVLLNQNHDSIAGSHSDEVDDAMISRYQASLGTARDTLEAATSRISRAVNTLKGGAFPFLVWNTLSFERSEVVRYVPAFKEQIQGFRILDGSGNAVPFRVVGAYRRGGSRRLSVAEIEFVAERVPALGYRLYRIEPVDSLPLAAAWTAAGDEIANANFHIRLDLARGVIAGIRDLRSGQELFDPSRYDVNELVLQKETKPDLEGTLDLTGEELRERGGPVPKMLVRRDALGTTLRIEGPFFGGVKTQEITLHNRLPRIDFTTRIAGFSGHNGILSVALPLPASPRFASIYDTHGAAMERPDGMYNAGDWVDLQYADRGVALFNQGTGGHQIEAGLVRLQLLRSFVDYDQYQGPKASEAGGHTFRYSLHTHAGDWSSHGVVNHARSFQNRLYTTSTDAHPGTLPPEHSFVATDAASFEITAIKKAETGGELILRGREIRGQRGRARIALNLPVEHVWTADLRERQIGAVTLSGGAIEQECGPFEVVTFRLKLKST